jgi:hypothetical protein
MSRAGGRRDSKTDVGNIVGTFETTVSECTVLTSPALFTMRKGGRLTQILENL